MKKLFLLLFFFCFVSASEILYNETQTYRRTLTPIECSQGDESIVFWREMRVYNVTAVEGGVEQVKHYATFTLHFKNNGDKKIEEFLIKEHLPEIVAENPEDFTDFSVEPYGFEHGSVVVTWLFENVEPGETRSVEYTVEKELNEDVLNEFDKPKIVVAASNSKAPTSSQTEQCFDWTTPIIALLTLGLAGVIYYFTQNNNPGYQS